VSTGALGPRNKSGDDVGGVITVFANRHRPHRALTPLE